MIYYIIMANNYMSNRKMVIKKNEERKPIVLEKKTYKKCLE